MQVNIQLDQELVCECGNKNCKCVMALEFWPGGPEVELRSYNAKTERLVSVILRLDGLTQLMEACQKALEYYNNQ